MRTSRQLALLSVITLTTLTVGAAPAVAEVPSNDTIENATVITALPYTVEQNIKEATKSPPRPSCDRGTRGNVWWKLTAPTDGWVVADTGGSRIATVAAVYTGAPGALTEVACNDDTIRNGEYSEQARVYWETQSGTDYYLLVAKDYGGGGALKLTVQDSAPPFTVDAIDANDVGAVDNQTGIAVLRGTVTCTSGPGTVWVGAELIQQFARVYIRDYTSKRVTCDGVTPWRMKFESYEGLFASGPAEVSLYAEWLEGNGGFLSFPSDPVHLRVGS
jgi:hypothetical protein